MIINRQSQVLFGQTTNQQNVQLSAAINFSSVDQVSFSGVSSGKSKIVTTDVVNQDLKKVLDDPDKQLVWTTDFDGVIGAFTNDPSKSHLTKEQQQFMLGFIDAYNAKTGLPFVFVTGRPVEDIVEFLGTDSQGESVLKGKPVWINGLHGGVLFDCETQTTLIKGTQRQSQSVKQLEKLLTERQPNHAKSFADRYPDVVIEAKGHSLAIHDKSLSKEDAKQARQEFYTAVDSLGLRDVSQMQEDLFVVKSGEGVLEVLPKQFTKGEGIKNVMAKLEAMSAKTLVPFFVGDGLTDNDGFGYLNQAYPESVTVFVGKPNEQVQARYTIANAEHTGDIHTGTPEGDALRTAVSQRNVDAVKKIMKVTLDQISA